MSERIKSLPFSGFLLALLFAVTSSGRPELCIDLMCAVILLTMTILK